MSSTASNTQETELDPLFRSHRLDNILPDAFAHGAVPTLPTGHLSDLYQFLACDPPAPVVLPSNLDSLFHNELQNNGAPLNPSDSTLLARIFKNAYRPDNESLRSLTLLDTTTTDHVYLYNTTNRNVTAAVEQLAIGLTREIGLTTFTRSNPVPNTDYFAKLCPPRPCPPRPKPTTLPEPTAKRVDSPPPHAVSPPVRRAQSTPRHSTGKGKKTRSSRPVEPSPSNKETPKTRTSKTSLRAEILPEDKVPVSIHTLRGIAKKPLRQRRKSSVNPTSETETAQPSETSPGSSQGAHISESETTEIVGNSDSMPSPAAESNSTNDGRSLVHSRAVSEDQPNEDHNRAKKPRICNANEKNTAANDKGDIDDPMVEDENDGLVEDNNDPMDEDGNGSTTVDHTDINGDTNEMTSISSASLSPSNPSDEPPSPSEIENKTPFRIPTLRSSTKKASGSTPTIEDTPSNTRRSARHQESVTPASGPCAKALRYNNVSDIVPQKSTSKVRNKRFKCDVDGCAKGFIRKEDVERHHKDKHQHLKHPCPVDECTMSFSRSDKLTAHVNTHNKGLKKKSGRGGKRS